MDKPPDGRRGDSGTGLFRLLMRRHASEDGGSSREVASVSDRGILSGSSHANASSSSNASTLTSLSEDYVRDNSSLLSLQPCFYKKGSLDRKVKVESLGNDGSGIDDADMSMRSVSVGRRLERNQSSLRSRQSRRSNLKPLTSMQNCLIPSLYNEQFQIEEYILTPVSSPRGTNLRPFLVTDGNKVISKSRYISSPMPLESGLPEKVDELSLQKMETVIGIPPLPESRSSKRKKWEVQSRKVDNSKIFCKDSSTEGLLSGLLLFFLGLRIGMMSTSSSNRKEVEKLTDLLQHTENLVQDLQEELEMKDSLSVKELVNDEYDSSGVTSSLPNMKESTDSKPMSNIEAELEVELEILVQNMGFNSRENHAPSFSELDPGLEAEVVHGDLIADMLEPKSQNYWHHKESSSESISATQENVNYTVDYAVCPKELSLRLYQVIESRLQERIRELEDALHQSQRQIHLIQSEPANSQRTMSTSDLESSSNQGSPVVLETENALDQPMFVNLSGDALGAYNEFYEELMKISNTQEEKTPLPTANRSLIWGLEGDDELKKPSTDTKALKRVPTSEQILRSHDSEDTDDDSEDEEGKMLIQQMVKEKRHRSPVFVHAQKMLFLMDE